MSMKTMSEARYDRWEKLFEVTQYVAPGSLWWVPETLWKQYAARYHQESERSSHPGIALLKSYAAGMDLIPMAHGTTPKFLGTHNRAVLVLKGITEDDPDHLTLFGQLFAPIPPSCWRTAPQITRNQHKPSLTTDEYEKLDSIARMRGWIA